MGSWQPPIYSRKVRSPGNNLGLILVYGVWRMGQPCKAEKTLPGWQNDLGPWIKILSSKPTFTANLLCDLCWFNLWLPPLPYSWFLYWTERTDSSNIEQVSQVMAVSSPTSFNHKDWDYKDLLGVLASSPLLLPITQIPQLGSLLDSWELGEWEPGS